MSIRAKRILWGLLLIILGLWNFYSTLGALVVTVFLIGVGVFYIIFYDYAYTERFA